MTDFADVQAAAARLAGRIRRTPMLRHRALDEAAGGVVLVKPEPLQITASFKLRGATNAALQLPEGARGVVTHSSGNHGQAAAAAHALGLRALIAMPEDAAQVKVDATRAWGAEIHRFDRHGTDREAMVEELAQRHGLHVIPPYDHPHVIAGQGTAMLELIEDARAAGLAPAQFAICTGGGGLLAGSALSISALCPGARIFAVEPEGWDDTTRSLRAGQRLPNDLRGTNYCDALLAKEPGVLTFAINQRLVTGGLVVSEAEVRAAMRFAFTHLKLVVEPGGAVALAALLAGKLPTQGATTAIILSGGNVDPAVFREALAA